MSATLTQRAARAGSAFAEKIRKAATTTTGSELPHGTEIYAHSHLQTNQVVYSLQKHMKNNKALAQIPYNGKKTVPAAIRKDMWLPFAKIEFPEAHAQTGLDAFRILREYRKLHETQWDPSFTVDKDGKPLSKKMRGRKLCDQRANSIADMAATLTKLSTVRRQAGPAGKRGQKGVAPVFQEHTVRATVRWANLHDAEYAEKWPETVVHDTLEMTKNNRRVIQEVEEEQLDMDGEVALA